MKTVTVHVTDEDITFGVRRDSQCCPVARAIERTIGNQVTVMNTICLPRGPFASVIGLPPSARSFIRSFDLADAVTPFKFRIELP